MNAMSKIIGRIHPKLISRKHTCKHAWISAGYLYLPVREVVVRHYKGQVYNLGVHADNTYMAKNFVVHNCDGPFFKGKKIAVIGGGNSGVTNALYLAEMASKAFLIEFMPELNCDEIYLPLLAKQKNLEILKNTQVLEIIGREKVEAIKAKDRKTNSEKRIPLDGIFIYAGLSPRNELAKQLGARIDEKGFVKVNANMMSSIEGFFAAGDITGGLAQTVWAAAEGAKAALEAYNYIKGMQK